MTDTDLAAAIGAHLLELVAAMRARGIAEPRVGVVISAGDGGVVVGTYLQAEGGGPSRLDRGFTDETMRWARDAVACLPAPPAPGGRATRLVNTLS